MGVSTLVFLRSFSAGFGVLRSKVRTGYPALIASRPAKEAIMRVKKTRQDQRGVYRYPVDVPDGKGGYRRTYNVKIGRAHV